MEREIPVVFTEIATAEPVKERGSLRLLFTVIRPHQWVKNLFVLAPLLFGQKLTDTGALWNGVIGFTAFCCLSSAVYIFNDWWDAEDDRAHPEKRNRPISSGALPASTALAAAAALTVSGLALGIVVGPRFAIICLLYGALMAGYCLWLKRAIVLDAMTIAVGFVLRVLGRAVASASRNSVVIVARPVALSRFLNDEDWHLNVPRTRSVPITTYSRFKRWAPR